MKSSQMKLVVCYALAASLLLLAVSCGKPTTENAVEEGIASISSETISEEMIASIAAAKHPSIGYFNTERDSAAVSLTAPPAVGISYQYKVGSEGLVAAHRITSGNFSWTVEYGNGVGQTTHVDGSRPCDAPGTQHIPLDKVKDYGYAVDISLEEEMIQSYTIKAYPVGNYHFDGTECTIQDGKLPLLKGKYYYELIIEYTQGQAVYGFFVD